MSENLPPRELWPTRTYTLPEFAAYPDRFNPAEELLDKQVEAGRGDRTAILFEDQRITYAQLLTQTNKLGNALRELGVKEGDRVMLRVPNIPPALVANFAILKLGAVYTPTSPLFSRTEIAHVANDSEAVAIIVSAALLAELEAVRENLETFGHHGTPQGYSSPGRRNADRAGHFRKVWLEDQAGRRHWRISAVGLRCRLFDIRHDTFSLRCSRVPHRQIRS